MWDVLPGVLLLSHLEDALFVAGKAAVPLVWARRGDSWGTAGWGNAGRRVRGGSQRCGVRSWEEGVILLPFLSLGSASLLPQQ